MTLVAAWVGIDSKKNGPKVASLYFATDSRISWSNRDIFDESTKSFGMENHPDIFSFCGDVLFATMAISQIIQQADKMMFYPKNCSVEDKFALIKARIAEAIKQFPKNQTVGSFQLLYATRDANKDFHCYQLVWSIKAGLDCKKLPLPNQSNVITAMGSGAEEFLEIFSKEYDNSKYNNHGTSRTVYHCFTETLKRIKDPRSGGAPQIVGLYRIKNALNFGIINKGRRFLGGREVVSQENLKFVEWRNENFERVDPHTMQILSVAQKQPK